MVENKSYILKKKEIIIMKLEKLFIVGLLMLVSISVTFAQNTTNETGTVTDITGYTDPDEGVIDFQAITEGNIKLCTFPNKLQCRSLAGYW